MIFPNKLENFQKTILKKSIFVLRELKISNYEVMQLYSKLSSYFNNINEYQQALDLLYALNKIDLKEEKICYIR